MSRENNAAMGRSMADPQGLIWQMRQAALGRVALPCHRPTMPASVRLAENGLLDAEPVNITWTEY